MQVKKTTQETVYPSSPSPGPCLVLQLSIMDLLMPRCYSSRLFFFTEQPLPDASFLLKASLAETLTFFYPCAGRFRETNNGGLEIVCNDAGAVFIETWVDRKFDDFLPHFHPHPDFALLVPAQLHATSADISHIPLLLAQVTHFECGHICLGFCLHHSVCDGLSTAHFLSTWAALTKSKASTGLCGEGAASHLRPPHIDRSLLQAHEVPSPTSHHPEYQTHMRNPPTSQPPCTRKIFPFTPSSIAALRAKASPNGTSSHSRFEALAAHLWRGVIHARSLAPNQEIRLGIAVDGRKRFKPPLPEGYFGNVIFYGYTACMVGELLERPLQFAADLVKAAVGKVTDAHMRSALDWVAKQESPNSVCASFRTPSIDHSITSWWRFPLYDVDFGWGKPSFVRTAALPWDGVIALLPSPMGPAHVDAQVTLPVEHMPRFEDYIGDV